MHDDFELCRESEVTEAEWGLKAEPEAGVVEFLRAQAPGTHLLAASDVGRLRTRLYVTPFSFAVQSGIRYTIPRFSSVSHLSVCPEAKSSSEPLRLKRMPYKILLMREECR